MDFARAKPEIRARQVRFLTSMIWFLAALKEIRLKQTRRTSGASKPTEVCQFQLSSLVDQQVLGLQVSVQNLPPVAVGQAAEQLEEKQLQGEKPGETSEEPKVVTFKPAGGLGQIRLGSR